jgi:hypothetical protein
MKAILTVAKFLLFFATFAVASFLPPFHMAQVLSVTSAGSRIFIWDGVVLMVVLLAVILASEAWRKRLPSSGPWTMMAFALAALLGWAAKFGFLTRPAGF